MEDNIPIIELKNVDITNGDSLVISGLSLIINPGEFVYLTGKVGSGKTSIIRTLIGENLINTGYARIDNFNLLKIKRKQIPFLRREIGVVFQDFQLLMDRSVEENLMFVLKSTGWKDKEKMMARIENVLNDVKMASKAHKMPHQLSGGEQQRIAIARALLNDPKIILADEPTGNLDSDTSNGIMGLLKEINIIKGTAVMMVTHNREILKNYPGRILLCEDNECREL
ncbi:MAG: ATP-binding cassette domain-containing protein [Bacteroidales bacterium]|jgi:cell division transport system ATP-binding protein